MVVDIAEATASNPTSFINWAAMSCGGPFYVWYTYPMKLTNKIFKEILSNSIGREVWGAREVMGVKFDLGKKLEENMGEFHFWIFTTHWWLQRKVDGQIEDIVNSASSEEKQEQKITVLNGLNFLGGEYHEENNILFLDFQDGYFLTVAPWAGKTRGVLDLFTENEVFAIKSDGTYTIESIK